MGQSYRLLDVGFAAYKHIMFGRALIGRVAKHSQGGYVGVIKTLSFRAETETAAFEGVAALHMGYDSAAQVKQQNRAVRKKRKQQKEYAKYAVSEMLQGNFEPLDVILGLPPKKRVTNVDSEAR